MSRFDALLALVSCGADALENNGPNRISGDDDTTTETSSLACDDKPTSSGGSASKKRKKSTAATSPSATRSRTVAEAPSACGDTASETASSSGGDYGDNEGSGGGTDNPMSTTIDASDPKEAKKQRRLVRNRMSAQLHRERKKAYIDQLEEQLKSKDDECAKLRQLMEQLSRENDALREKISPPAASSRRPAAQEAAN